MTDEGTSANLDRIAILTTKVERESRFTRSVIVICTIANLAVAVFAMKMTYEWLPPIMLAHFMEHMPDIVMTQKAVENANARRAPAPAPAATK